MDGVLGDRPVPARVATPERFVRIAAGLASSCGIRGDGRAFCWGRNEDGELGDGTEELLERLDRRLPVLTGGARDLAERLVGLVRTSGPAATAILDALHGSEEAA